MNILLYNLLHSLRSSARRVLLVSQFCVNAPNSYAIEDIVHISMGIVLLIK